MKTVNIKGKEYVEVNERIKYFRENFKGYRLLSEIVSIENGVCIIKASILDSDGNEVANGIAYEKEGNGFINKFSYIENCETSAWGRALGNLGIGIDTSIASSEEVGNAILNQNKKEEKKEENKPLPIPNEAQIKNMQNSLGKFNMDDFRKKYTITPETEKLILG